MYRWLSILGAIALSACATTAGYEKVLNSWMGSQELELVRSWGPPAQAYEAGGRKFIMYSSQRNVYIPGVAPTLRTNVIGSTAYTSVVGGSPASNINMACSTTFELENSRVVSWSYKGNDCKAKE
ncbi:MAG: hypothetical protein Q7V16_08660 [Hydrogenophaga sp.]|nr:hypothetical protein [Hydrogenophaga sp.]MDP1782333.1 hypothetical protein [Hydrogenophaga sp.]